MVRFYTGIAAVDLLTTAILVEAEVFTLCVMLTHLCSIKYIIISGQASIN